jgi:hypothetical protein
MPNYVTRMWMRMDAGLAATLYGPSEISTEIDGHSVTISEETDYPFRDTISFTVKTERPITFSLGVRIPEWCPAASLTINGAESQIDSKPGSFVKLNREFHDGDSIVLRLPMNVRVKDWFGGSGASVERGPLVYSLKIDEKRVESMEDPAPIKRVLKGNFIEGFPAVQFFPESEWRFGIDVEEKSSPPAFKVIESPMPENPFLQPTVPVRIEASLRPIPRWAESWKPVEDSPPSDLKSFPHNPQALPADAELQSAGARQTMTLVPYGSTYLRLTTIPMIRNGN